VISYVNRKLEGLLMARSQELNAQNQKLPELPGVQTSVFEL